MACIMAETFVAENHRALRRARHSLYHAPTDPDEVELFLFAGWLRLEAQAQRNLRAALRRRSEPRRVGM